MKYCFIFCLFCSSFVSFSQDTLSIDVEMPLRRDQLGISITPMTFLSLHSRYTVGVFKLFEKSQLSLNIGIGSNAIGNKNKGFILGVTGEPESEKFTYFDFRPEYKWSRLNSSKIYWAVECLYTRLNKTLGRGRYYTDGYYWSGFSQAKFQKVKIGVIPKLIVDLVHTDKLLLEFYGGVGIAVRRTKFYDFVDAYKAPYETQVGVDPFFGSYDQKSKSGGRIMLQGTLGFRFSLLL